MRINTLKIARIRARLSSNALETLRAVGMDSDETIGSDLAALQSCLHSPASLLETCLNGAEDSDTIAGWTEYVAAVDFIASE